MHFCAWPVMIQAAAQMVGRRRSQLFQRYVGPVVSSESASEEGDSEGAGRDELGPERGVPESRPRAITCAYEVELPQWGVVREQSIRPSRSRPPTQPEFESNFRVPTLRYSE